MEVFADILAKIDHPDHRLRTEEVLGWVANKYPSLVPVTKWNQPMFTDHDTYIIGFSVSKQHLAVAPEQAAMMHFDNEIKESGLKHTKEIIRFPWNKPFDFTLLEKLIEFNILDKKDCKTFWRV